MTSLKLYAVRNAEGLWFRAKGFSGRGDSWVSDISKAKLYAKIGQARGRVSFFANLRPDLPAPELVELVATVSKVIDETERVATVKQRKAEAKQRQKIAEADRQRRHAERQIEEAKATLSKLKADASHRRET